MTTRALLAPTNSIHHSELGALTVLTVEEQGGAMAAICCRQGRELEQRDPVIIVSAWADWDPQRHRWVT